MIRVRKSPISEWATTLIAWMALSESSLRLDKRAFEDLCTFRNSRRAPPPGLNLEAVISSCAGLVVVDSEGYLDFFHSAAKSFFASDRDYWFPGMAREQAETCCEYLSMEAFGSGPCKTDFRWDERMVMHPFYIHAATSWGKYARKALDQERSSRDPRIGETLRRAITTFLGREKAVQAAMQVVDAFKRDVSNAPEWDQAHDRLSVQVATYFKLTEIVDMLLLLEAAKTGKLSEIRRLLKQGTHVHGFGPDSPLRSAILNGHKDVVGVLLEYGTDANSGSACEYPLDWAMDMEGEIGDITRLLLDYGADPTKIRTNLLSFAVRDEDMNMAKLLIGKGVDINAADESRWTALHFAAMNGLLDFVLILLKHLPVATAADLMGRTPLDHAEQNGKEAVVRRLREYMHETI
ncbi:putative ankyrin repeat protein FPV227 [Colletotrichum tropicale]|nr:putative ankyrin repeat protein FPV227 [Colletotrichum tropicale]